MGADANSINVDVQLTVPAGEAGDAALARVRAMLASGSVQALLQATLNATLRSQLPLSASPLHAQPAPVASGTGGAARAAAVQPAPAAAGVVATSTETTTAAVLLAAVPQTAEPAAPRERAEPASPEALPAAAKAS